MMFVPPIYTILLLLVSYILRYCAAARILPNDGSLLNPPAPSPILNHNNASASVASNDLQLQCRGGQFGDQLDYAACRDALRTFTKGDSPSAMEIGRRDRGRYAYNLPWKWVSGKDLVLKALWVVGHVLM